MMSKIKILISLGKKVFNAVEHSKPIPLAGKPTGRTPLFSLKNPHILEAIPDKYLTPNYIDKMSKLEGKSLKEACAYLDKIELNTVAKPKLNLHEMYAKELEKAAKNADRPDVFLNFAKRSRAGEFKGAGLYERILTAKYSNIRFAKYTNVPNGIDKYTILDKPGIKVNEKNGWHYRLSEQGVQKSFYRISINANGSKGLIDKLDSFVSHKCYYKTPADDAGWAGRHDPITMYFSEKPTQEFCQRLMKVLNETKAIRSKNDVLVGQKLMDGVTIMKEPTHDSIKLLLERCEKISPEFRVGAKSLITTNSDGQMFCSAGQYYVIEDLLKMLECV